MMKISSFVSKFFIFAFFWCYLASTDLTDQGYTTDLYPFTRHLPTIISLIVLFIYLFSRKITFRFNKELFLMLSFFIISFIGSLATIIYYNNNLENSFIGRSLSITIFFSAYFFVKNTSLKKIEKFARVIINLLITFSIIFSLQIIYLTFIDDLIKSDSSKIIFHSNIVMYTSVLVLTIRSKNKLIKYLITFLIILTSLKITKNTTYIVLFLTLTLPLFNKINLYKYKFIIKTILLSFLIITALLYIYLWMTDVILPEGSTSVRYVTYMQRINEIIESPLTGTMFIGTPLITVSWLVIPSHSDILDIISFGGLLGFVLFAYPTFKIFKSYKFSKDFKFDYIKKISLFFYISNICWFVIMMFNAPFANSRMIFFFWFGLGFILALKHKKIIQ